jgi:hypothetical protein
MGLLREVIDEGRVQTAGIFSTPEEIDTEKDEVVNLAHNLNYLLVGNALAFI